MTFRFLSLLLVFLPFVSLGFARQESGPNHLHHATVASPQANPALEIPAALQAEHRELHEELLKATKVGGQTGKAAERVAEKLHAHFLAEEQFALPPLGLLKTVAEGKSDTARAAQAIRLSEQLRQEYSKMLAEHVEIKKALAELDAAAATESRPEQQEFARKLALHAETEETVLYPATLLLGQYLKAVAPRE